MILAVREKPPIKQTPHTRMVNGDMMAARAGTIAAAEAEARQGREEL
jgi:hypothetical protein